MESPQPNSPQHKQEHKPHSPPPPPTMSKDKKGMKYYYPSEPRRAISSFIVFLLLLAGITALIVWLVYRPNEPHFMVVGAAIYDLNTTSPNQISTTMQFTIVSRNPNKRTTIYYDHLLTYVVYKNQQITYPVMLPPFVHETKSTVALSPLLGGGGVVPVSMEVANGLMMDQGYGVVSLKVVLLGRVRYHGGSFKSRRYGMYVKCDVLVGLKKGVAGQVPLLGSPDCNVDI